MVSFFDTVLYPREFIAMPLELALLTFHISVTVLIAVQIRRRVTTYTHAFFRLYLIQCAANYMCYVTVGLSSNSKSTGMRGSLTESLVEVRVVLETSGNSEVFSFFPNSWKMFVFCFLRIIVKQKRTYSEFRCLVD